MNIISPQAVSDAVTAFVCSETGKIIAAGIAGTLFGLGIAPALRLGKPRIMSIVAWFDRRPAANASDAVAIPAEMADA
jgi:hypothetical protein